MSNERSWDELNQQRQALEQRRDELMQQQTPREEVTQVNNAVDQIREVLSATSGDASEVKDKIGEHLGKLKDASTAMRDALNDPRIQELTEGIAGGLDTASGMLEAADNALGPIDEALDALQSALELADAQPAEQLEALASALEAASERLGPLIERIPGLGQFFELYVLAIRNIANSVGQIQAVQARLQRIWATVRPGTQMYPVPRTAQERLADEIRDLDREIGAIVQQMIGVAQTARESGEASDGTPEPEVVVRSAESRCADERIAVDNPQLLARNDAWHEFEAAQERWSAASGQYELACQEVDRAESAMATATGPTAREGAASLDDLQASVDSARSARESAGEILEAAEANYDDQSAAYRGARAAFDAERQAYIDCVKAQIIGLIPFLNRGGGFSASDFSYLAAIYPEYAITAAEFEAAQQSTASDDRTSAAPATAPGSATAPAGGGGILDQIRSHPVMMGLATAGIAVAVFVGLTFGGGDSDSGNTALPSSPSAADTTASPSGGGGAPTEAPTEAPAAAAEQSESLASAFLANGTEAALAVAVTYDNGSPLPNSAPDWADEVSVRLLRGDDGIIYVHIQGPSEILRALCGEIDLLQGSAHLAGDFDFCAEGTNGPGYFTDIQNFDLEEPSRSGQITICTGLDIADGNVTLAIWLFRVEDADSYEAVEFTAATGDIADAAQGTDFSGAFRR